MSLLTRKKADFLEVYGPEGYNKNYKELGFDLYEIIKDYGKHNLMPKSILDAGCASGKTVLDFRRSGIEAYGIEILDEAFKIMPKSAKKYCKKLDMRELHKWNNRVDSIYCNALMYLTEKQIEKFISTSYEIVNESIYIVTPFANQPGTIPNDPCRVSLKKESWWLNLLTSHGFTHCPGTDLLFKKND